MRFLIDENLHLSLARVANEAGHEAHHLNWVGLRTRKDAEIASFALRHDFVLVTNNRGDFLKLYRRQELHCGLVVVVPNVIPSTQRLLFRAVLRFVGEHGEPVNTVIEADLDHGGATVAVRAHPLHLGSASPHRPA